MANFLGIAPAATFLGLTPVGWAIAGTFAALASSLGYYFTKKTMRQINEERAKGGLELTSVKQIIREVRLLEKQSLEAIMNRLSREMGGIHLSDDQEDVTINGQPFSMKRLKYIVNADGSEEIVFVTRTGRKKRVLLVKAATALNDSPT